MSIPKGPELIAVGIFAIIIFVLLIIATHHFISQNISPKSYLLSLKGESTYSNYPVSAFVDDSQIINIFGLNNVSGRDDITMTDMIGQADNLTSSNIGYRVYSKSNPQNQTEPIRINVTASGTKPGLFQGLMMIRVENTTHISIPLTFTSDVITYYAVIWIMIGIFTSFIFWEFIKVNQKKRIKVQLEPLKEATKTLDKTNLPGLAENLVQRVKHERMYDYLDNRYKTRAAAGKIVFVDIVSIIFGIAIGLIGLLNNDFVNNIRFINPESIVILFGTGLAIGSIKELVDKPD